MKLEWPTLPGVRIDSGIREGQEILTYYDPLLAKIIAWGPDREQARQRLAHALRETVLLGLRTNQGFLVRLLESEAFKNGETFTHTVESVPWPDHDSALADPMILAAVLALNSSGRAKHGMKTASKDPYSPWESLGRWRVLE